MEESLSFYVLQIDPTWLKASLLSLCRPHKGLAQSVGKRRLKIFIWRKKLKIGLKLSELCPFKVESLESTLWGFFCCLNSCGKLHVLIQKSPLASSLE